MFPVQRKFLFPTRIYIEIPLFLSFNLIFGYIRRIRKTSNPFFSEKGYARYAVCLEKDSRFGREFKLKYRKCFYLRDVSSKTKFKVQRLLSITLIIKIVIWRIINWETAFVSWKVYSVRSITISKCNWYHFPVNMTLPLSQLLLTL